MTVLGDARADLDPGEVRRMLADEDAELIDVREDHEWEAGRIPGGRHIALDRLGIGAGSLPRDRPLIFYCRVGARSAMAAEAFRAQGWDAYNLAGGIIGWVRSGGTLDPPDGEVAGH